LQTSVCTRKADAANRDVSGSSGVGYSRTESAGKRRIDELTPWALDSQLADA